MAEQQRVVKLRSASGEIFEVDEAVASQSQLVRNVIEDVGVESPIPLPNVSTHTLGLVLHFCNCKCYADKDEMKRNSENFLEALEEDFNKWLGDAKLVELVDAENLFTSTMAANYMHIDSLLEWLCHTIARMIAERTFGEIRQIFNFNNEFARAKRRLIGKESQILASLMESLPMELHLNIKVKVGQRFHYGKWSPWRYDVEVQVLVVELANLRDASINMQHQIAITLLHIDIGLVRTLVLQTCSMMSVSSHSSGGTLVEIVDPIMDDDLFKDLFHGIDRLKIENVILDEES